MSQATLIFDGESLWATRYLTLAGLVVCVWDTVLTFPQELDLVWRTRLTVPKIAYLINKYAVCGFLGFFFSNMTSQGDTTMTRCASSMFVLAVVGVVSIALANGLVLLRVYVLWGRRRVIGIALVGGYAVTYALVLAFVILSAQSLHDNASYNSEFESCVVAKNPRLLVGVWAPILANDIYAFALIFINALDRPRGLDEQIVKVLYRDGLTLFIIVLFLRLMDLVISAAAPAALTFLGLAFVWAMVTVIVSRLILKLYAAEEVQRRGMDQELFIQEPDPDMMRYHHEIELDAMRAKKRSR